MLRQTASLLFGLWFATTAQARPALVPITSSFIGAAASSRPSSFIVAGSKIFFTADDAIHGREVWATDGTPAGTTLAADANPGSTGSYPTMIGSIGSAALFLAYDGTSTALWRSDATAAGTVRLMTVPPSTGGNGYAVVAVAADTKVYVLVRQGYSAPVQLFVSDGTVAGTREVGAFPLYLWPQPVGLGGSLFCVGQDASVGAQLWVTDGTAIGTHIVRRGVECPGSSCGPVPATFFRVGNRLLFLTSGALWRTDGTAAGTVQIAAIPVISTQPFTAPASPVAYFVCDDGSLWKTDGISATRAEGVTAPGAAVVLDDGRLAFLHATSTAAEVWKSDGTSAGTLKLGAISNNYARANPSLLGSQGSRVLISGWSSAAGYELWAANLDTNTIGLLKDIDTRRFTTGPASGMPGSGIALGGAFIFTATDIHGTELWQSDGSESGTALLANIAADPGGGVVSGTVRAAADGTPVGGATVFLCPPPDSSGACDLVVADPSGSYHFDGVIPGSYTVGARSTVHVTQYYCGAADPCPARGAAVSVTAGMETTGIDFSLIVGGTLAGTVIRRSTGEPLQSIEVQLYDASGVNFARQTTDGFGRYKFRGLATGTYYALIGQYSYFGNHPAALQAYLNHDCLTVACDWHNGDAISITTGVDTAGIDFSLREYATIAGVVRNDLGSPVQGLNVYFLRDGSTSPTAQSTTAADGSYLSPLLAPGSYYVLAGAERGFGLTVYPNGTCGSPYNCTPAGGSLITLALDGATRGIDLQLTPSQSRLEGTIRDRTGAPLVGATVEVLDGNGYYISAYGGPAWTDSSGHYEFNNFPAGTYYLGAVDQIYPDIDCLQNPCSVAGATPLVLTTGHTSRADMQLLSQRTTISGHILDAITGQPITDTAGLGLSSASGRYLANGFSNAGTYEMSTISRETGFRLSAGVTGYHSMVYDGASWGCSPCPPPGTEAVIPAGTNTNVDFLMKRLGAIRGSVTEATTGKPINNVNVHFVTPGGSSAGNTFTDFAGQYVWYPPTSSSYYVWAEPWGNTAYKPQVFPGRTCAGTCVPSTGDLVAVTDGVVTPGIDFHLPDTDQWGTINGHVVDAESGLPMADVYVAAGPLSDRTDANGFYSMTHDSFFISGLTTGGYKMWAEASAPYFIGLSGGGTCADFYVCRESGTAVQVTAPGTTTVDFRMIRLRVTSVWPAWGPPGGGTQIVVHGANFVAPARITVGGLDATVTSVTPTDIVAITPAAPPGAAHVTVILSPSLSVTLAHAFSFVAPVTFTDDPVIAGVTTIQAVHLAELRAAVNRIRSSVALGEFPFTDPALSGRVVGAVHLLELRRALDEARAVRGIAPVAYTNTITPGAPIRAIDLTEFRNAVR